MSNWPDIERNKMPSGLTDNPALHDLVAKMTEGVTAEAYFGAKNRSENSQETYRAQSHDTQAVSARPAMKSTLDPNTTVSVDSLIHTAQLFLGIGSRGKASDYFRQALEKDPGNTIAREGLEKAMREGE